MEPLVGARPAGAGAGTKQFALDVICVELRTEYRRQTFWQAGSPRVRWYFFRRVHTWSFLWTSGGVVFAVTFDDVVFAVTFDDVVGAMNVVA